jgi:small-conductance mechanosensitive channel
MPRHHHHRSHPLTPREWAWAIGAGALAVAAVAVGTALGKFRGPDLHDRVIAWCAAGVLVVVGTIAVRRLAFGLGHVVARRSLGAAAVIRFALTGLGMLLLVFAVFGVLGVSLGHLLIGAGVTGVIIGIAAQQSLSNVFASLVLLFARPFVVGDRIRIRSGAIGTLDATVLGIGLTYVTVRTDDGILRVPNSAMLASGIGQLRAAPPPTEAVPARDAAPGDEGG